MLNRTLFYTLITTKNDTKNPVYNAHSDLSKRESFPEFYKPFCLAKKAFAFSYSPNRIDPKNPTPIKGVNDPKIRF